MTSPAARKFIQEAFAQLKEHELREVVEAISKNLPGGPAATPPWQPIETAPKDGSRCDVWTVYYDAYQSRGERHVDAQYREQHAAWFDLYGNKLDWSEFDEADDMKPRGRKTSHWMPQPGAPVSRPHRQDGAE